MKLSINKAKEIDENMNTFATMNVKKIDAQKIKVVNDFSKLHF